MGLDMYMNARLVTNTFESDEEIELGYWRKANAVHNWIINNCANGVDECQRIDFPVEKAKQLLEITEKVLRNNKLASKLLPTASGFFFGGTEYDDWYFNRLEDTKEIMENVINYYEEYGNNITFYYQASW